MRAARVLTLMLGLLAGCAPVLPEKVRLYNADGLELYQRGEYRAARDSFQAGLELAPEEITLRYNLGQAWDKLGNGGKAEEIYKDCLNRDPSHGDSHRSLCMLLVRQGRAGEASKLVEGWLAREPERGDAYALDGWLWHQAGDLPRAQSRLQQAIQFDPINPVALAELGVIYETLERPERALALYERSLARQADQPDLIDRVNRLKAKGVSYPRPD